jgi:hypothetical protein
VCAFVHTCYLTTLLLPTCKRSLEIFFSRFFGPYPITPELDSLLSDPHLGDSMASKIFQKFKKEQARKDRLTSGIDLGHPIDITAAERLIYL